METTRLYPRNLNFCDAADPFAGGPDAAPGSGPRYRKGDHYGESGNNFRCVFQMCQMCQIFQIFRIFQK